MKMNAYGFLAGAVVVNPVANALIAQTEILSGIGGYQVEVLIFCDVPAYFLIQLLDGVGGVIQSQRVSTDMSTFRSIPMNFMVSTAGQKIRVIAQQDISGTAQASFA